MELLAVVLLLVVVDLVAEDRVILEVVLRVGQFLEFLLESSQRVGVINEHLGLGLAVAVVSIHLISVLGL